MRGILFVGDRRVEIREFPDPEPGPGEVLLRVRAAGLCGSDFQIYRPAADKRPLQYSTTIPGHETAGEVIALGPGSRHLRPGDRVMVHWTAGCNHCPSCKEGWTINCSTRPFTAYGWNAHGGDAELMVVDERSCVPLPEPLTYDDGAIIACGGATSWQALKRVSPSGLDTVTIIGLGPVGLSAIVFAKGLGAKTIGVDINPARVEMARKMGADYGLSESGPQLIQAVKDLTDGKGGSAAVDCSGTDAGRNAALDVTRVWGRVAFVGEGNTTTISPSPQIIHKQLTVFGSWYCGVNQLHEAAEFLVSHGLDLARMVTRRVGFQGIGDAIRYFEEGAPGKVIFSFDA